MNTPQRSDMTASETPRTDAFAVDEYGHHLQGLPTSAIWNFARQLETELSECQAKLREAEEQHESRKNWLYAQHDVVEEKLREMTTARDEAVKQMEAGWLKVADSGIEYYKDRAEAAEARAESLQSQLAAAQEALADADISHLTEFIGETLRCKDEAAWQVHGWNWTKLFSERCRTMFIAAAQSGEQP